MKTHLLDDSCLPLRPDGTKQLWYVKVKCQRIILTKYVTKKIDEVDCKQCLIRMGIRNV